MAIAQECLLARTRECRRNSRAVKFGDPKRATAPLHERLLLAGLLLVVTGWIILRLVQMLLAAH